MTLIVAVCLVGGGLLILSSVNDWSIQQTVRYVLDGTAGTAAKGVPTTPGASGQSGLDGTGSAGGGVGGSGGGSW